MVKKKANKNVQVESDTVESVIDDAEQSSQLSMEELIAEVTNLQEQVTSLTEVVALKTADKPTITELDVTALNKTVLGIVISALSQRYNLAKDFRNNNNLDNFTKEVLDVTNEIVNGIVKQY